MLLGQEVASIVFGGGKPTGVSLASGQVLHARNIVYSGTVWNLYGKLIDPLQSTGRRRDWAMKQVPTYASVVLYAVVDREAIPEDTAPIEMLATNPDKLDEGEVTAYILSIDDRTLCAGDEHTVIAIGPTFEVWDSTSRKEYLAKKDRESNRLLSVLENRFPGYPRLFATRSWPVRNHRAVHPEEWWCCRRAKTNAGPAHAASPSYPDRVAQPLVLR